MACDLRLGAHLPPFLCQAIQRCGGPSELYPWQEECLREYYSHCSEERHQHILKTWVNAPHADPCPLHSPAPAAEEWHRPEWRRRNFVYCAPTSGGKSLVADILVLQNMLITRRPAIFVLPLITLCEEKSSCLQSLQIAQPLQWKVIDMFGSDCSVSAEDVIAHDGPGIIICTIEKANVLINKLWSLRSQNHFSGDVISTVVVDELHMLGDPERGYQIEILLSKLRYGNGMHGGNGVNIIAMSATLPNGKEIASWLDAVYYDTTFRPLSLRRFLVHPSGEVFDDRGNLVRVLCHNGLRSTKVSGNPRGTAATTTSTTSSFDERGALLDLVAESCCELNNSTAAANGNMNKTLTCCSTTITNTIGSTILSDGNKKENFIHHSCGPTIALNHPSCPASCATLIFCASRTACVRTAVMITKALGHILPKDARLDRVAEKLARMYQLSEAMDDDHGGEGEREGEREGGHGSTKVSSRKALLESMRKGVGFHHAGLDSEQRRLIENAFKEGSLKILCATSTLAAGVNLPARRVIIRHPFIGGPPHHLPLNAATYLQMAGRAGRTVLVDRSNVMQPQVAPQVGQPVGEAYLMAAPKVVPLKESEDIVKNPVPDPIRSCLREGGSGMARALLEAVATGAVSKPVHIKRFVDCTLLAFECKSKSCHSDDADAADMAAKAALKWLGSKDCRLITWNVAMEVYEATAWGKAVLAAGLPPASCLEMRSDLIAMSQLFFPTTELHLAYLCVPGTVATDGELVRVTDSALGSGTDHWRRILRTIEGLKGAEAAVAKAVGVDMAFLVASARGLVATKVKVKVKGGVGPASSLRVSLDVRERVCRRVWGGLIICDVLRELGPTAVAFKYGTTPETVKSLQNLCSRQAGILAAMCGRVGWTVMEELLSRFRSRIAKGVAAELLELVQVPGIGAYTARQLYRKGMTSPEVIALVVDEEGVEGIIDALKSQPLGGGGGDQRIVIRAARIARAVKEYMRK